MEKRSAIYIVIYLSLLQCFWTSEKSDNIINIDDSIQFGQKVDEESIKKVNKEVPPKPKRKIFNISEHVLILSKVPDGRPYGVFDNIVRAKAQVLLKSYLTYNNDAWLFNNYDQDDENKQKTHDNVPWINEKDPLEFSQTHLCKRLITAVKHVSKEADEEFFPYRVFGKILRRGDHTLVSADSNQTGDFTAFVFVNEFWRKNYYGELYLYDNEREIIGGATHRPGRVVIYESTILHLNRPPAVQFLQGQVLFQVQFSKSKERMEDGHKSWFSYVQARDEAVKSWNLANYKLPNGDPFVPADPEEHKVFEYTTKGDKRKIFVYDNLFPKDLLDHLRDFVLKYGKYFYDDSIDKHSDNVQWIAGFLLKPYLESPYWKIVQKVAKHATGSETMFPYDISINLVRNSDHTRIHGDVSYYGEKEFTCLVYLNPNWKKNYYGETTFFEKNSDDTEVVAQVRPRYGRTVIFDGNIPHSARPPSFNFTGARLTFVTKLHRNEYTGRKKNLQEEHRHMGASIGALEYMQVLASKKGESYAKRYLDDLRKTQADMAYRPDEEDEEEEKGERGEREEDPEDQGKENEQDDKNISGGENGGDEGGDIRSDGNDAAVYKTETEQPFFDEEQDDEYTRKLAAQLEGVTGDSVDGVEKLEIASENLREIESTLTRRVGETIIKIL